MVVHSVEWKVDQSDNYLVDLLAAPWRKTWVATMVATMVDQLAASLVAS